MCADKYPHNQIESKKYKARMLYKFKSKTNSDLIMLEPHGRRMLEIIGIAPAVQGILLVANMPAAIGKLEAAIAQEQVEDEASAESGNDEDSGKEKGTLTLRQRASPFLDLLKRCSQDGSDLVWGV
jgi:hypothetical protein